MTRLATLGILVLLMTAVHSPAQTRPRRAKPAETKIVRLPRRVSWTQGMDAALIKAELTDAPILVYCYLQKHRASLSVQQAVLSDRQFRKLSALFVMVPVEGRVEKKVSDALGVKRFPAFVFLDSSGETIKLLDSHLNTPRVLNYMARSFLISMYNSGKRARETGNVRAAVRKFRTLQVVGKGTPPAAWAGRELGRIEAEGIKQLSKAKIALDGHNHLAAMAILDDLVYSYRSTSAGAQAKKLVGELRNDPKAVKALEEARRRQSADRKLARATKLDNAKRTEDALIVYWDVVRDFPGTPASDKAADRAEEIVEADRALALRAAKTRMKRDCSKWMEMAKSFEANNNRTGAILYYTRIIDHYRSTSYAKKARAAIDRLMGVAPAD